MRKIISFKRAARFALLIFGLLAVCHLAVILGILFFDEVPTAFLWGGRLQTQEGLLGFEVVSLLISIICVALVLIRTNSVHIPVLLAPSRVGLWILCLFFMLNTLGNLTAPGAFEKVLAPITLLLAFLCLRMALEPL